MKYPAHHLADNNMYMMRYVLKNCFTRILFPVCDLAQTHTHTQLWRTAVIFWPWVGETMAASAVALVAPVRSCGAAEKSLSHWRKHNCVGGCNFYLSWQNSVYCSWSTNTPPPLILYFCFFSCFYAYLRLGYPRRVRKEVLLGLFRVRAPCRG